ncbi:hypothetical protein D3871_13960 [Noviherbaspirillum saxi]|uniref:Uncharacterized protein n=1 Tax=Noviherbaspirillum saxi TaxID=2320863 RepID=A0A3A3FTX8_9BURK|nr:hypothetical protein D3871_13960 [Noviherbaspirillum saxi]
MAFAAKALACQVSAMACVRGRARLTMKALSIAEILRDAEDGATLTAGIMADTTQKNVFTRNRQPAFAACEQRSY